MCRVEVTGEGTFCTVTGAELAGPALEVHDFRHCCNTVRYPTTAAARARRAANGLQKRTAAARSLRAFESALFTVYGESATRNAARARWRAEANRGARKMLSRPVTLGSVMAAIRAVAHRKPVGPGAPRAVVDRAAKAVWSISKRLPAGGQAVAGLRGYADVFGSTIVSKAGPAIAELDTLLGTTSAPAVAALRTAAPVPSTQYGKFGIAGLTCRLQSKMWRRIKTMAARI